MLESRRIIPKQKGINGEVKRAFKAQRSRKLKISPMKPETSTREKPIKAHRIKLLEIEGLREKATNNKAKIIPTPIATPVRLIRGILEARYLRPNRIMMVV